MDNGAQARPTRDNALELSVRTLRHSKIAAPRGHVVRSVVQFSRHAEAADDPLHGPAGYRLVLATGDRAQARPIRDDTFGLSVWTVRPSNIAAP